MRVIALNFADADFATPGTYREYLLEKVSPLLTAGEPALVVLPAHSALLLAWSFGDLGDVQALEDTIDELSRQMQAGHARRLKEGRCSVESGLIFLDVVNYLERIADHVYKACSSGAVIAEATAKTK